MTSENYRQLLNNEYNVKELNQEEFDDTLMHFAMLYYKEQLALYNVSNTEGKLQAVDDLIEFARNNCREWNNDEMEEIIDRL